MKKIIRGIVILLLVVFTTNVNAKGNFTIGLNGGTNFNNTITIELKVNNVSVDGSCGGICGLSGKLNYDSNKISLISKTPSNGFDLTEGTQLVMLKNTGVGSGTTVLTMTFKNVGLANGESTTISFTNAMGSDGDSDINVSNATKSIKYEQPTTTTTTTVRPPVNTTTPTTKKSNVATTTKNSTKGTTTTTTNTSKAENNYIKSISLSSGKINFKKETLSYEVIVGKDIEEIDINATLENEKATITGNGNHKLKEGLNVITLMVTAEDLSTREYTINIYKDNELEITTKGIGEKVDDTQEKKSSLWLYIGIPSVALIATVSVIIIQKRKKTI